ncbi:MAG: hypothetical protein J3K34DRAFT_439447 [Monoraphidium minutum]|nr:MAG: hypothetical protein J3K34DRAFT_439447 [Monoraphidium minutum]
MKLVPFGQRQQQPAGPAAFGGQGAFGGRLQQAAAGRAAGAGPFHKGGLKATTPTSFLQTGGAPINCNAECRAGSATYCLPALADTCGAAANGGCHQADGEVCDLYRTAGKSCGTFLSCPAGFVFAKDDKAGPGKFPKWKAMPDPAVMAPTGIESIAADPAGGSAYDGIFMGLWASATGGNGPYPDVATQAYVNDHFPIGIALNAFAGRTRHFLHIHVGTATKELATCAEAAAAAIGFHSGTWSPKPTACDFSSRKFGGASNAWVFLQPTTAGAASAPPSGVGQAVWRAFNKGPLAGLKGAPSKVDGPAHYTSLGITKISHTAAKTTSYYYAVVLANTYASKAVAGEYQFLEA